jgi:hypothetical protein
MTQASSSGTTYGRGEALSVDLWVLHEGSVPKDRAIVAASAWLVKPHHACMLRCILQPGRHFEPGPGA